MLSENYKFTHKRGWGAWARECHWYPGILSCFAIINPQNQNQSNLKQTEEHIVDKKNWETDDKNTVTILKIVFKSNKLMDSIHN